MAEKQIRLPIEPKYSQNWHKYNLAKTNEKFMFIELLNDLTKIIKEPEYKFGRSPHLIKDLVFCCGLKLYSNYSGRKAMSEYRTSMFAGYISKVPHFNSLKDFLNCPATYDLLSKLLTLTAIPLKKLEDQYSIDSSGFGSYTEERWNRVKWGKKVNYRNYLKGHVLIGTKTNIICEAEVTPGNFSDVRQAPNLILKASKNFNIKEFSGDKAYSSRLIHRILYSLQAMPYIPFKHNAREPDEHSTEIWDKCFLMFRDNKDEWEKHYHKRSNVETTFSMIKRRFGEHLLSKNYNAQRNELMMKFICHNIACLIQEIFERKIEVDFRRSSLLFIEREVGLLPNDRDGSDVQNEDF
jgi:transposase